MGGISTWMENGARDKGLDLSMGGPGIKGLTDKERVIIYHQWNNAKSIKDLVKKYNLKPGQAKVLAAIKLPIPEIVKFLDEWRNRPTLKSIAEFYNIPEKYVYKIWHAEHCRRIRAGLVPY